MTKKRIFYKVNWASINGQKISGLQDVGISINFNLSQHFCSCPFYDIDNKTFVYCMSPGSNWCDNCRCSNRGRDATQEEAAKINKKYRTNYG